MQKISLFQPLILGKHSILESRNQIDHTHFWSFPPIKLSIRFFFFLNWYQHAKNQAISLICSGDFFHLKILQSDWQRAF